MLILENRFHFLKHFILVYLSEFRCEVVEKIQAEGCLWPDSIDIRVADSMGLVSDELNRKIGLLFSFTADVEGFPCSQVDKGKIKGRILLGHLRYLSEFILNDFISFFSFFLRDELRFQKVIDKLTSRFAITEDLQVIVGQNSQYACCYVEP